MRLRERRNRMEHRIEEPTSLIPRLSLLATRANNKSTKTNQQNQLRYGLNVTPSKIQIRAIYTGNASKAA